MEYDALSVLGSLEKLGVCGCRKKVQLTDAVCFILLLDLPGILLLDKLDAVQRLPAHLRERDLCLSEGHCFKQVFSFLLILLVNVESTGIHHQKIVLHSSRLRMPTK